VQALGRSERVLPVGLQRGPSGSGPIRVAAIFDL
jgi:hypothetical protein